MIMIFFYGSVYFSVFIVFLKKFFNNALTEGNILDTPTLLRQPEASLFRLGIDLNHRFNNNDYKI